MNNATLLFHRAAARLDNIAEELSKPEEDIVTLSACIKTREVMRDFFSSFLQANDLPVNTQSNLEQLKEQCAAHDIEFDNINLGLMYCYPCRADDQTYCLGSDRVHMCLRLASQLKRIVAGKTGV